MLSILNARPPRERRTALTLTDLARTDFYWAGATGALAATLFATSITSHPGLGDAPESVAGVTSLGILHAPGYPAYVLAARAFSLLVPVGSDALRVNLFSLVCASLSIAGVQLVARRCGAARWASSLGALALAVGAGFWFYAGFAKHDMFSGLMLLVALHLLLGWEARPTTRGLAALGVAIGVGLGSSWPLAVLLSPTVAFVLLRSRRLVSLRALVAGTTAGLVVVAALYGFVMFRAAQSPAINWGDANNVSRLVALVGRADFTPHGSSVAGGAAAGHADANAGSSPTHTASASLVARTGTDVSIFWKELGVAGFLLAGWGLLASLRWRRTAASVPLLLTFAVNLAGAAALVGAGGTQGFDTNLIEEGFLLGCYFPLACWAALGASDLVSRASGRLAGRFRATVVLAAATALLAAAVLVPSVVGHWSVAHRDSRAFADQFATTMFSELPRRAAVLIWGAELSQPLIYRQIVEHQRRDVIVIAADGLSYDWYRQQLSHRLGRPLPPLIGDSVLDAAQVAQSLGRSRPVYLDPQSTEVLRGRVNYRTAGLVSQLVTGPKPAEFSSPAGLAQSLQVAERAAGMPDPNWDVWPNANVERSVYSTTALKVARAYSAARDFSGVRRALQNVLAIEPQNQTARADLSALDAGAIPAH